MDIILITHGHGDHIGDVVTLARAHKPKIAAIYETGLWLEAQGLENVMGMGKGGTQKIGEIEATLVNAFHSNGIESSDPGAPVVYGGEAGGFIIRLPGGLTIYHAGDTCVFGDMRIIGGALDFVGLNVYQPEYARADDSKAGYAVERRPTSYPHMASPWLFIGPEAIYWAVRSVTELWNPKALYITENGCSAEDYQDAAGRIEDTDRVMYLRNYLTQLHRAVAENYPVKGYFLWSLMDNFEWADGYGKPFGIYHVDFKTQKRTPKRSALWYREVIARNAVG